MPAEALVSRAKSYGFLKTCKTLGKTCFPPLRLRACQKELRREQAEISLGLVGIDKVHNIECSKTKHDNVLP